MPVIQTTPFPLIPRQRVYLTRPTMRASRVPHYKLFLHRSKEFDHSYISKIIHKTIDDMNIEEARDKTTEAYLMGRSLLRVYPLEIAEDCCEKIRSNQVDASIEAVNMF